MICRVHAMSLSPVRLSAMIRRLINPAAVLSVLCAASLAGADETRSAAPVLHERAPLDLDLYAPPVQSPPEPQPESSAGSGDRSRAFGRAGSRWWSIGTGYASDFGDDSDINIHGIFSQFIADELEFGVEAAAWYFDQDVQDTGGVSGSMIFRWHFAHDEDFTWSVFGDVGIGLLAGFDEVPAGGTEFNFLPRIGAGYTRALDSTDPSSARLTLGVRWHHISNARIEGEERNPARDSLMGYIEIQFPF